MRRRASFKYQNPFTSNNAVISLPDFPSNGLFWTLSQILFERIKLTLDVYNRGQFELVKFYLPLLFFFFFFFFEFMCLVFICLLQNLNNYD